MQCYIRCAFCNSMNTLKEAALDGWEMCRGCQLVFCTNCKKENEEEKMCPGSVYTTKHKQMLGLLPVEQIIDIAKDIQRDPKEGKYISKIFFEDERKKIRLLEGKEKKEDNFGLSIIRFREEQWRKFGTVLVKRKDGKFITWGQLD